MGRYSAGGYLSMSAVLAGSESTHANLDIQLSAVRLLTRRDEPPRYRVWVTRCGFTARIEVEARSDAEAKVQARYELDAFEAHRQHHRLRR
jgi:hypothetical protein